MGAYLNKPIVDKNSEEGNNERIRFAATAMQGWRINQEDAHNCIIDYDKNCSLFAVYDGHGGSEVAQYASTHLPGLLKERVSWKRGDYKEAIKEAFLEFDNLLRSPDVIQELRVLAGQSKTQESREHSDDEDKQVLYEEAAMPLQAILSKYGLAIMDDHDGKAVIDEIENLRNEEDKLIERRYENNHRKIENGNGIHDETFNEESYPLLRNGEENQLSRSIKQKSDLKNGRNAKRKSSETESDSENGILDDTCLKADLYGKQEKNAVGMEIMNSDSTIKSATKRVSQWSNVINPKRCKKHDSAISSQPLNCKFSSLSGTAKDSLSCERLIECNTDGHEHISKSESDLTDKNTLKEDEHEIRTVADVEQNENKNDQNDDNCLSAKKECELDATDSSDTEHSADEDYIDDEELSEDEEEESDHEENIAYGGPSSDTPGEDSGTTACLLLIFEDRVIVGNAGDSRAVLCRKGTAIELSVDHKPEDDLERRRIEAAGGEISIDGRVNGGLNLSRALGDHFYKKNEALPLEDQMISSNPDVNENKLEPDDEFVIVACDGIWNSLSSQEAVDFVRNRLSNGISLKEICEQMCDECLSPDTAGDGTGCDNMTVVIMQLLRKDW